jgi:hypothetical protein
MPDPKDSPAVQSIMDEQASQRAGFQKGALYTRLEDTFPASDPVSATHTTAPTGRTDADEAERVRNEGLEEGYPLVMKPFVRSAQKLMTAAYLEARKIATSRGSNLPHGQMWSTKYQPNSHQAR